MDSTTYINERLDNQIAWYSKKSSINKKYFNRYKWIELSIGCCITIATYYSNDYNYLRILTIFLSSILVVIVALHGLHNFHENWIEYRKTAELLKNEKYTYLYKAGVYKNLSDEDRFILLVERCESIISHENINWANINSGSKCKQ